MLQQTADPERDGIEMPMHADAAPAQIFGAHDVGVHAHHDATMIEPAMRKHRDRGNRRSSAL